ncbi:hypothetical protein F4677DRAFT_158715 [Hypoxylon crocopeplum]|nr:hypothetical protein F4677DRAFT_158715 [Hypoxylon crocopeplum]
MRPLGIPLLLAAAFPSWSIVMFKSGISKPVQPLRKRVSCFAVFDPKKPNQLTLVLALSLLSRRISGEFLAITFFPRRYAFRQTYAEPFLSSCPFHASVCDAILCCKLPIRCMQPAYLINKSELFLFFDQESGHAGRGGLLYYVPVLLLRNKNTSCCKTTAKHCDEGYSRRTAGVRSKLLSSCM